MKSIRNLVMICLDGARVDMVNQSTELVNIFNQGSFFQNAIVSSPYTVASIHSLMTGMFGYKNGVNAYNNMFKLKKDSKLLSEYFRDNGYWTSADMLGEAVVSQRGFDEWTIHDENSLSSEELLKYHQGILKKSSSSGKRFFTFLQYSKIHTGCVNNVAKKFNDLDESYFTSKQRKINKSNFIDYTKDAGNYSQGIINYLKKLDILDNTLVIFFSDHGTSLGEKFGEKMYGSFLYDYTIKTFIHFFNSNFPNKKIETQIRCIDIMPTILECFKIKIDKGKIPVQGSSLLPILSYHGKSFFRRIFNNKPKDRIAYVETGGLGGIWPSPKEPNIKCIKLKDWKLIHNLTPNEWELYDTKSDPNEEINLFHSNKEITFRLKKYFDNFEKYI